MPSKPRFPKVCVVCKHDFLASKEKQLTCSLRCRARLQHEMTPERMALISEARAERIRAQRHDDRTQFPTVEAARAARLAREKATGQRTFTIGDGWEQRSNNYGNPGADTQGHGFK